VATTSSPARTCLAAACASKSRKRYYDRTLIEVAVPYTPSQPALFIPAQIVFFQELPEQQLFRYGVAYLQLPKPKPGNHF